MTRHDKAERAETIEDLDATIAEYAQQDTAYKARVKETQQRREEEHESRR